MTRKILERIDRPRAGQAENIKEAPRGMVLIGVLVILVVLALLGAALMFNARNDLMVTGNVVRGHDAFTRADSAITISSDILHMLLNPDGHDLIVDGKANPALVNSKASIGPLGNDESAFIIEFPDPDRFTRTNLLTVRDRTSIRRRYVRAGWGLEESTKPDIIIRNRQAPQEIVASVIVSRDFRTQPINSPGGDNFQVGSSLQDRVGGNSGGSGVQKMTFTFTVFGRQPMVQESPSFFVDKDKTPDFNKDMEPSAQSVITAIYQEVFSESN